MPVTIGQQLKTARLAKNLSLEKVTQVTHIKPRLLEAMEADDFESLPSPVQARAFLRLYVEFLGLSLDEMIARQRQDAGEPAPDILSSPSVPTQVSAPEELPTQPDPTQADEELPADKSFPILDKIKRIGLAPTETRGSTRAVFRASEPTRPSLPISDPEPAIAIPSDPITPPVFDPVPVTPPDPIAILLEEPMEEPAQAQREESPHQPGFSRKTVNRSVSLPVLAWPCASVVNLSA